MSSQQAVPESKTTQKRRRTLSSRSRAQQRLHYLDWLRVVVVVGVFYAHVAWLFDILYSWQIENDSKGYALVVFGSQWGMALIFLLTGASAWFSLKSRTSLQFLGERVARLAIPFLAGIIFIAPLQAYFLDLSRSLYHGSLLQYAVQYVSHMKLNGSPQSLTAYSFHLWFLAFLFLFSLLALPLFLALRGERGEHFIAQLAALFQRRAGLFVLLLPLALIRGAWCRIFRLPGMDGFLELVGVLSSS